MTPGGKRRTPPQAVASVRRRHDARVGARREREREGERERERAGVPHFRFGSSAAHASTIAHPYENRDATRTACGPPDGASHVAYRRRIAWAGPPSSRAGRYGVSSPWRRVVRMTVCLVRPLVPFGLFVCFRVFFRVRLPSNAFLIRKLTLIPLLPYSDH